MENSGIASGQTLATERNLIAAAGDKDVRRYAIRAELVARGHEGIDPHLHIVGLEPGPGPATGGGDPGGVQQRRPGVREGDLRVGPGQAGGAAEPAVTWPPSGPSG